MVNQVSHEPPTPAFMWADTHLLYQLWDQNSMDSRYQDSSGIRKHEPWCMGERISFYERTLYKAEIINGNPARLYEIAEVSNAMNEKQVI